MPFNMQLEQARIEYPEYTFISALTPSEQKAAFHVRNAAGEDLCLKIIAPNYDIARLDREIMALQSISHPNVVRLREYTRSSKPGIQRHYMVEDYVAGTDLGDRLLPNQQWSTPEVSRFFAELCDGLSALRDLDIVHRDLKPSNIRVRPNGSPVIIDFGLARLLDQPDLTSTSEGAAIGTLRYFSPEQCRGTKYDIDHRTDLFAVGVLLYQALTGRHPFWQDGITDSQFRDAICESFNCFEALEFSSLPDRWRTIVRRLLNKERAQRPYSAAQVGAILRRIEG
jgi:serine/threonine protein kinase